MPFLLSSLTSLPHPFTHTVHLLLCANNYVPYATSQCTAAQYGKLQLIVNPRATRRENCLSLVQHGFKLAAHLVDVLCAGVAREHKL